MCYILALIGSLVCKKEEACSMPASAAKSRADLGVLPSCKHFNTEKKITFLRVDLQK